MTRAAEAAIARKPDAPALATAALAELGEAMASLRETEITHGVEKI